ncbi:MAG: ABC transporter permease, partial [Gemmatimonadales bacterium]
TGAPHHSAGRRQRGLGHHPMTSAGFVGRLAWRQARAARRRLALLSASVVAGVGALVAVNSFTSNLTVAVAEQAQDLLGADLSFGTRSPADQVKPARRLLDSLRRVGGVRVQVATSASFAAMAYLPGSGGARLVQVRTVDPGWPYYGTMTTSPTSIWPELQNGGAIADPSLLTAIGARIGDTLGLGEGRFRILGTVTNVPGDIGLEMAFGARVFIATKALPATRLLSFGSRALYETFLKLPPTIDPQAVARANSKVLRAERISVHTIADDRDNLTRGLIRLGNYLGLVALAALLLGGLGVASAVHVFIRQQLDTIAVLRCLGATSGQIFAVYLLLSLAMGLLGSVLGALLGVGLQQLMPHVVHDFLPVNVRVLPSPHAILIGIGSGLWTASVFALLPLLGVRRVPPLATLRRATNPTHVPWDRLRIGAALLLPVSVVGLAALQVGSLRHAIAFAAGCSAALFVLWLTSLALIWTARQWAPATWPYLLRQGLANLHRPANQTVTVVLALGFGAFILTTLFTAQQNLLRTIRIEDAGARPNLVLFDIQPGQRQVIDSVLTSEHLQRAEYTPIVPMRIRELKGQPVTDVVGNDTMRHGRGARGTGGGSPSWAARREFRSTYRSQRGPGERITSGHWFAGGDHGNGKTAADPVEISMEEDLARELGAGLGDPVTWDVQGVPIYSRITSLREVNWARFEPNFFVVFAPGALEHAPQSWVTMVRAPDAITRGRVQREVAEHAANVTAIDLGEIQHAIESVIDRIVMAVRFMALFSLVTGTIVLIGAIATSRWQRIREGTLLRTLGATRGQVLVILCVEYAALGLAASIVASALAGGAGWALATWVFDTPFVLPLASMAGLAAGLIVLTTIVGLWNSLDVLSRPPLEVLRAE